MKSRKLRNIVFTLHRYIGLVVGLIVAVIGLTGSLLIFEPEIEHFQVSQRFGNITPQGQLLSIDSILENIKAEISQKADLKIGSIIVPKDPTSPYEARLWDTNDKLTQMFINPYTGKMMGMMKEKSSFLQWLLRLHYELLAGKTGMVIAGIAGLFLFILSATGLILWPGWRKLIAGFKIKSNAHPKRFNFDIHKVAGVVAAVFLTFTGFTGFCWNFYDWSSSAIYALTFTSKPTELVSKPISGKAPVGLSQVLLNADAAIPKAVTTYIGIPDKHDGVIRVGKRQTHETSIYGQSEITLDQYSGQVLRVADSKSLNLGDNILNSFAPLHYGTFWGLPSRILYVFVGLAPLILFVTGFVMWWYRKRKKYKGDKILSPEFKHISK
ncbi:peptidase [Calothrix sp. HK-06]|nr:peptidase [Calothrix sp. HK-06]